MFAEVTWASTLLVILCRSLLSTQLSLPLSTEALSKLLPGPGPLLLLLLVTLLIEDFASHLLHREKQKLLEKNSTGLLISHSGWLVPVRI